MFAAFAEVTATLLLAVEDPADAEPAVVPILPIAVPVAEPVAVPVVDPVDAPELVTDDGPVLLPPEEGATVLLPETLATLIGVEVKYSPACVEVPRTSIPPVLVPISMLDVGPICDR